MPLNSFQRKLHAASVSPSRQDLPYHIPMHIGQPIVPPAEAKRQAFVIESHEMQDRGVQVVDVDPVQAAPV